jgi:phosphoglycolate phosphatase
VTSFKKIAIFDLDGTLVDSVQQIARCFNRARVDYGYNPQTLNFYKELVGLPVYELLSDIQISGDRLGKLIDCFRKYLIWDIQSENNVVFPGVCEILNLFTNMQFGLAVATSKPTRIALEVVKYSAIKNFSIHVQGTEDFLPKPNPEVILRVINHYPSTPSFMVGDRTEDIQAAREAKIPSVGIASGAHSENKLKEAGANMTFQSIESFYKKLKNNSNLIETLSFSSLQQHGKIV